MPQVNFTRSAAIVQASVFDAVNGIEMPYTPAHVVPDAPRGASARAAAVQAAYASLVKIYPGQQHTFDAARAVSLAAILDTKGGREDGTSRRDGRGRSTWVSGGSRLPMPSGPGEAPMASIRHRLLCWAEQVLESGGRLLRGSFRKRLFAQLFDSRG